MRRTRPDFRFAHARGALPVLGHAVRAWRAPLSFLHSLSEQGDLVHVRLGRKSVYLACHPELADQVLRDPHRFDTGGPGKDELRELFGDGILTCPNAVHKRVRRLVQPSLQQARIARFITTMVATADAMTDAWRSGVPLDVTREMTDMAAMTGVHAMFAAEFTEHFRDEVHTCLRAINKAVYYEVLTTTLGVQWLFRHRTLQFHRTLARYKQVVDEVISLYRHSGKDHADILSVLLAAQDETDEPMSDHEVRENVINMFTAATAAGPASTMVWALHLLDLHPDIARRVQHEIDSVLGDDPPDESTVRRLELTRQVVLETLRLYPHAWLITRCVAKPVELAGQILPPGTSVVVSPYQLHRQPRLFPDPERFDPDRWAHGTPGPHGAYIPFSNGSRQCPGKHFALTEVVVVLARVLQNWTLHGEAVSSSPAAPRVDIMLEAPPLVMTPQLRTSRTAFAPYRWSPNFAAFRGPVRPSGLPRFP
ncbi:cytochrome P450 [Streptomyces barringtoniae]|uniref:cytochrome P450 n=1 Tax=Streptomyces barringtoniae TaxID=2892029 RepID=UPI001E488858|nr:cytochrome P450 [Streptomyces barringtoniae]MCC5480529.1 cytochrome P450 [Streptomyces barringtoniae]